LEPRQLIVRQRHLDRAGLAGDPDDQTSSFELDDHLVDGGWCDLEELLEIGFGGWSSIQQGVRGDERQILPCFSVKHGDELLDMGSPILIRVQPR
jgi:hypothetical protein